jgi:hypothetical protein
MINLIEREARCNIGSRHQKILHQETAQSSSSSSEVALGLDVSERNVSSIKRGVRSFFVSARQRRGRRMNIQAALHRRLARFEYSILIPVWRRTVIGARGFCLAPLQRRRCAPRPFRPPSCRLTADHSTRLEPVGDLHRSGGLRKAPRGRVNAIALPSAANRPSAASRISSNRAASTAWFRKPWAIALRAAKPRRRRA